MSSGELAGDAAMGGLGARRYRAPGQCSRAAAGHRLGRGRSWSGEQGRLAGCKCRCKWY